MRSGTPNCQTRPSVRVNETDILEEKETSDLINLSLSLSLSDTLATLTYETCWRVSAGNLLRNIALRMKSQTLSKGFYTWKENVHGQQETSSMNALASGLGPGLTARGRLSNTGATQAPNEDRIVGALHAIHTTVRQLAEQQTVCQQGIADLSRRFSHFEQARQAERGRASDTQPPAPRGGQRGRARDGQMFADDNEEEEEEEGGGEAGECVSEQTLGLAVPHSSWSGWETRRRTHASKHTHIEEGEGRHRNGTGTFAKLPPKTRKDTCREDRDSSRVESRGKGASIATCTFMTASLGVMDIVPGPGNASLPRSANGFCDSLDTTSKSPCSRGLGSGSPARAATYTTSAEEQSRATVMPTTHGMPQMEGDDADGGTPQWWSSSVLWPRDPITILEMESARPARQPASFSQSWHGNPPPSSEAAARRLDRRVCVISILPYACQVYCRMHAKYTVTRLLHSCCTQRVLAPDMA